MTLFGLPFWPALAGYFLIGTIFTWTMLRTGLAHKTRTEVDGSSVLVWPITMVFILMGGLSKVLENANKKGKEKVAREKSREKDKERTREELGV